MDNMARSKANDKSDPSNFPEDNGLRECKECGEDVKVDLTNAKEAEVEEFRHCFEHLTDIEDLREAAHNKVVDANYWKRRARAWEELHNVHEKDDAQTIARLRGQVGELVKDNAFLKRGWEIKDARIHELELGIDALDKGLKRLEELSKPEPITEAGGGK